MFALLTILFFAVAVERVIEYLRPVPISGDAKLYLSLILGMVAAVVLDIDALFLLGITTAHPNVTMVLTGVVIGGIANYINDVLSKIQVTPAPSMPVDMVVDTSPDMAGD